MDTGVAVRAGGRDRADVDGPLAGAEVVAQGLVGQDAQRVRMDGKVATAGIMQGGIDWHIGQAGFENAERGDDAVGCGVAGRWR